MPVYDDDGRVIAGLAASGAGIGPFVQYPGADPRKLIAGGRPANGEDLLVHYAARALRIELRDDPLTLIGEGARLNYRHRPSMLQDVLARRPTEIDMLNGGIVREGAAHEVPTPLHAAIHALVTGLQASWPPTSTAQC